MVVDGDSDKGVVEICNHCWSARMTEYENWQQIAPPDEGEAVCFELQASMRLSDGTSVDMMEQGFLLRFHGELRAWRNQCPHAGSPLDWLPGQFFSEDGQSLVCHTHHAVFEPLSGACLAGPCPRGLYALPLRISGELVEVPLRIEI